MTIGKHIAAIRLRLRAYGDDTIFTDQAIYQFLQQAAAVLNARKDRRRNKISDWNFTYYPIGMHYGSPFHDDCISDNCQRWISKHKLPRPLVGRNREIIDIRFLDGRDIARGSLDNSVAELDPFRAGEPRYHIVNNYLVMENAKPKAVLVGMIATDVTEWAGVKLCDEEGNDTDQDCFSIMKDDFPIDDDYINMAHSMVMQEMLPDFNLPNSTNTGNMPK